MISDSVTETFNQSDELCTNGRARSWSRHRNIWGRLGSTIYSLVTVLMLISPLPTKAQEKPLQIGLLALGPRYVPAWHCGQEDHPGGSVGPRQDTMPIYALGLLDELQKLKYVENRPENVKKPGRQFVLDVRMGTSQQLRTFAQEFVAKRVDILVAIATAAARIAQEETRQHPIPILITAVSQPVGEGFVQSLARPGGFITGVSHQLLQGSGKRVELFKQMLPGLRRMIAIRVPGYSVSEKSMVEIRAAVDRLKIQLLDWAVTSRVELETALAKAQWEAADGIMILPDSLVISNVDLVLETSLAQRVPAFGLLDYMADWGALAAYGPSAFVAGAHLARYVDKIINGAKPGDLPVEPIDPTFVVNLKAAECLGVTLPFEILRQTDRVIR